MGGVGDGVLLRFAGGLLGGVGGDENGGVDVGGGPAFVDGVEFRGGAEPVEELFVPEELVSVLEDGAEE